VKMPQVTIKKTSIEPKPDVLTATSLCLKPKHLV